MFLLGVVMIMNDNDDIKGKWVSFDFYCLRKKDD